MSLSSNCILLLFILFQLIVTLRCQSDDNIGFPENIEDNKRPADDRNALYMPTQCQDDELLYPGDQQDDWVCDCKPAYLYYPPQKRCFPAFEQGPCDEGKILRMPDDGFVPVCATNKCRDKKVEFQKIRKKTMRTITICVKLGTPCDVNTQRLYGVNATTLKVECLLPPTDRFGTPVILPPSSDEDTSTKKNTEATSLRPYVVNPRFGTPDEDTPPIDNVVDINNLFKYVGTRLAVQYNVCFPGCRRLLENKCTNVTRIQIV